MQDSDCEIDEVNNEESESQMHANEEYDLESIPSIDDHDIDTTAEELISIEESNDREAALWILILLQ